MEQRKVIHRVDILDLRKATEESIQAYASIGSVDIAVFTPETRRLLHAMDIGSINTSLEIAADTEFRMIRGLLHIGRDYFAQSGHAVCLFVMGPIEIDPGMDADELRRGLDALVAWGPIRVPEPLAGVLQERTHMVMGPVITYPVYETVHRGNLRIDRPFLDSLPPGSEVTVVGSVTTEDDLPAGAIRKKLARLHVTSTITCFEDQASEFRAALSTGPDRLQVVPRGHKIVQRPIRLDRALLETLDDRKLYFMRSVEVAPDVDAELYSRKIDRIACREWLIAPASLQAQTAKTCDLLETDAFFYEGTLWQVAGESTLVPGQFDRLEGTLALFVTGFLRIDPSVAPDLLAQRVDKVLLDGVIQCSADQQSALEAQVEQADGVFDRYPEEEAEGPERKGTRAHHLVL